ncbi:MAG: ABC transporter substrate-binding protein, partial [Actinomycetota bacterium]
DADAEPTQADPQDQPAGSDSTTESTVADTASDIADETADDTADESGDDAADESGDDTADESIGAIDLGPLSPPWEPSISVETIDGVRMVTHEAGVTEFPDDPQRILAVTGTAELQAMLALDITPFAAAGDDDGLGGTIWQSHLAPRLEGVEMLNSRRRANLEQIASVAPDLIIGNINWIEQFSDELSQLAPTIALDYDGPWQDLFRDVALLFDESDTAEAVIAAWEDDVRRLVAEWDGRLEGVTFSQLRLISLSEFALYDDSVPAQILRRLGMVIPDEHDITDAATELFSTERFDLLETDALLIYRYPGAREDDGIAMLEAEPLYQQLGSVATDSVFQVDSRWWWLQGAISAGLVVDDLERIVPELAASLGR